MNKNIFMFFLIAINKLNCNVAKKNNTIINGHDKQDKIDDILYVGMPLRSVIQLLGSPFRLNSIKNKVFYLFSERKIDLIPIKGKHKNGLILIIILDHNNKIKEIKQQNFIEYKSVEEIKDRKKEVESQIQSIEEKIKKINEKNKNEASIKIEKINKDNKRVRINNKRNKIKKSLI